MTLKMLLKVSIRVPADKVLTPTVSISEIDQLGVHVSIRVPADKVLTRAILPSWRGYQKVSIRVPADKVLTRGGRLRSASRTSWVSIRVPADKVLTP